MLRKIILAMAALLAVAAAGCSGSATTEPTISSPIPVGEAESTTASGPTAEATRPVGAAEACRAEFEAVSLEALAGVTYLEVIEDKGLSRLSCLDHLPNLTRLVVAGMPVWPRCLRVLAICQT